MNPKLLLVIWSFRKELKAVLTAFVIILMLPVIAVIILTQTGINIVSDKLVSQDTVNQTIEIKDPTTGEIVKEIKPVIVWPTKGVITLEFSKRSPYQLFHTGLDIASNLDEPVNPMMDGTVIYAGQTAIGFGKHVIIDNGDNIQTIYAHLNKIYVYKGQKVKTDTVIGTQGRTGWATGVHLHFQINIYGIPVNPRVFLGEQKIEDDIVKN